MALYKKGLDAGTRRVKIPNETKDKNVFDLINI
jgi:hypothetical protein